MKIAIVGHEEKKFTAQGKEDALKKIHDILLNGVILGNSEPILVSGGCHLGGIDKWAEEVARKNLFTEPLIFLPKRQTWSPNGYKERNLEIAAECDELHCIAVRVLAPSYRGMRFDSCYHCNRDDHVKGGGCWTMKQAAKLGKPTYLHIVENT